MDNLEKEIEEILRSLLASLGVEKLPHAEPLIDLTVKALLIKIEENNK